MLLLFKSNVVFRGWGTVVLYVFEIFDSITHYFKLDLLHIRALHKYHKQKLPITNLMHTKHFQHTKHYKQKELNKSNVNTKLHLINIRYNMYNNIPNISFQIP